jgi:S-formylglutathione hydrolase FrmB
MGRPQLTRRGLLLGALGLTVAGTATGAAMLSNHQPGEAPLRRVVGVGGLEGTVPNVPPCPVTVDTVRSAARGRDVDLVIMRPAHNGAGPLPVCLMLHGRGGTARGLVDFGIPRVLTAAVRDGVSPFAIAAVDCGEHYFVPRDGDDPLRMLLDEVPGWLDDRGLDGSTLAVQGISMGSSGALALARNRRDLRAVAAASPALFRRWPEAKKRNAFVDERQWQDYEPLRHTAELTGIPLGVWCGTEDPFVDAAREFITKTNPEVHAITRGEHSTGYWLHVLPDMMSFVGKHLAVAQLR